MSTYSARGWVRAPIVKRMMLIVAALSMLSSLGACSGLASGGAAGSGVSDVDRLAAGTLKLEGTGEAIGADTATQLLPLWQLMAALGTNSATAPQETAAVLDQIRATMSADQLSAIDEMQLSQADIRQTTEITPSSSSASTARSSGQSGGAQGGGPVGGPPPDGGGGIDMLVGGGPGGAASGGTTGPVQSATAGGSSSGVSSLALIQQVITMLQKKAAG